MLQTCSPVSLLLSCCLRLLSWPMSPKRRVRPPPMSRMWQLSGCRIRPASNGRTPAKSASARRRRTKCIVQRQALPVWLKSRCVGRGNLCRQGSPHKLQPLHSYSFSKWYFLETVAILSRASKMRAGRCVASQAPIIISKKRADIIL